MGVTKAPLCNGSLRRDDFLVHGSRPLLEKLLRRGFALYLASGTDERFVKQELKAPGTATFRDPTANNGDTTFSNVGDTYTVVSSVDAENSFGGKLRSAYTCVVTKLGGDQWQRVSVNLEDAG